MKRCVYCPIGYYITEVMACSLIWRLGQPKSCLSKVYLRQDNTFKTHAVKTCSNIIRQKRYCYPKSKVTTCSWKKLTFTENQVSSTHVIIVLGLWYLATLRDEANGIRLITLSTFLLEMFGINKLGLQSNWIYLIIIRKCSQFF
jgi:hypothetical protein